MSPSFPSQLQVKGTLNNGLNYTAGFSFESDGGDSAGAQNSTGTNAKSIVTSNEGYWIGFGAGNTSIEFGLDHATKQNPYQLLELLNFVDSIKSTLSICLC